MYSTRRTNVLAAGALAHVGPARGDGHGGIRRAAERAAIVLRFRDGVDVSGIVLRRDEVAGVGVVRSITQRGTVIEIQFVHRVGMRFDVGAIGAGRVTAAQETPGRIQHGLQLHAPGNRLAIVRDIEFPGLQDH